MADTKTVKYVVKADGLKAGTGNLVLHGSWGGSARSRCDAVKGGLVINGRFLDESTIRYCRKCYPGGES